MRDADIVGAFRRFRDDLAAAGLPAPALIVFDRRSFASIERELVAAKLRRPEDPAGELSVAGIPIVTVAATA